MVHGGRYYHLRSSSTASQDHCAAINDFLQPIPLPTRYTRWTETIVTDQTLVVDGHRPSGHQRKVGSSPQTSSPPPFNLRKPNQDTNDEVIPGSGYEARLLPPHLLPSLWAWIWPSPSTLPVTTKNYRCLRSLLLFCLHH